MKCRFEHEGDCCNCGASQYMAKCKGICDNAIPISNADRIRGMSDEELADLLCTADWCEACDQLRDNGTCQAVELDGPLNEHCVAAGLRWLRQPATK